MYAKALVPRLPKAYRLAGERRRISANTAIKTLTCDRQSKLHQNLKKPKTAVFRPQGYFLGHFTKNMAWQQARPGHKKVKYIDFLIKIFVFCQIGNLIIEGEYGEY